MASAPRTSDVFADSTPSSRPPPVAHEEGEIIAEKYRLVRRIGAGGMGEVWVAHNEALGVKVAIKLIGASAHDKSFVARLAQEAQAAASLGHPAIIRVFDFGKTAAGAPFIVMELLHGEDLGSVLDRRGNITEIKAVQSLLPVIHALAAAHDKGIVHRDLKPANIFMARMDAGGVQPKLLDFGVAKLDRGDFERVTNAGVLVGSPAYMSPEQARGEDVDHSADLWAICVVLYELITGTLPFNGDNYNQLLWAIAHDEPLPTTTQFGGDAKLWAILTRGFSKQPARRWGSMRDLGEALARWLHQHDVREDIAGSSLQTTWLDRRETDHELFAGDGLDPVGESPRSARPRRGEDAIPTLPGSFAAASQRTPSRRSRKMVAAVVAGLGVLAIGGGLWLARGSRSAAAGAEISARVDGPPATHSGTTPPEPRVEPASSTEHSVTAVAPLEEGEAEPAATAGDAVRRPEFRRNSPPAIRPQPWKKLKNPFD